jgi:hypothetical protein
MCELLFDMLVNVDIPEDFFLPVQADFMNKVQPVTYQNGSSRAKATGHKQRLS